MEVGRENSESTNLTFSNELSGKDKFEFSFFEENSKSNPKDKGDISFRKNSHSEANESTQNVISMLSPQNKIHSRIENKLFKTLQFTKFRELPERKLLPSFHTTLSPRKPIETKVRGPVSGSGKNEFYSGKKSVPSYFVNPQLTVGNKGSQGKKSSKPQISLDVVTGVKKC